MSNENLNEKIFYYRFNKLNAWLILNLALTITLVYWGSSLPMPVVLGANAGSFGRLSAFLARLGLEICFEA